MNKQSKIWKIVGKLKAKSEKLKVADIIGVLLKNREIKTQRDRKKFFNPTPPEKISVKSLSLSQKEINKAIKRIKKALKTKEKVLVYGDYDADGICGTAVLWETLYSLGLNVLPYIPERFSEGYGLNSESIKKLKTESEELKLIITVDHGIVANKKVDVAKELGIDVIITDHHQLGKTKPKAYSIIHTPKISGSAVAWVLSREIERKLKVKSEKLKVVSSLELVAIGTIADQIPLLGANRSFVKYGLEALNTTKRPGLLTLLRESGITPGEVGPYEVGFLIAPRLNAMGRLEHAMESLRLLCTKNRGRASELAGHLNRVNIERQKIVDEVVLHARASVGKKFSDSVIILAHESYHEGVIGLAAGKLVEEFYRPAIVLSKKSGISKASARSISGFNIIEAIRNLSDLYIEGGGHPMAAGFSIKTEMIKKFSKRLNEIAKPLLTDEILTRTLKIDLEVHFDQLNPTSSKGLRGAGWELYELVRSFEPTGLGNPAPTFATKKVEVVDAKKVGRESNHLKLRLRQNSILMEAIAFGQGEIYPKLTPDVKIDVAYGLEENTWNGNKKLQLKIKDLSISE